MPAASPATPVSGLIDVNPTSSLIDVNETFLPGANMRQITRVTQLEGSLIEGEVELGADHWVWHLKTGKEMRRRLNPTAPGRATRRSTAVLS